MNECKRCKPQNLKLGWGHRGYKNFEIQGEIGNEFISIY